MSTIECLYLLGDRDLFNEKLLEFSKLNKPHPLAATLAHMHPLDTNW